MPNAGTNPTTNERWYLKATQAGTYKFDTAGKYVDKNIELNVPAGSLTASTSIGTKTSGKYPATVSTSGTAGWVSSVSGTTNLNAIGLSASGTGSATISTVTVGTKSGTSYPVTGSATISGTASAAVSSTGYGTKGVETGSGSVSGTASLNSTIGAAAATVTGSGTASKPTIAAATGGNVSSTPTTTKPGSGYYIAVAGSSAASTGTLSKSGLTKGYLGTLDEITASNFTISASGTGNTYYCPVPSGSIGVSASDPGTSYNENTTAAVSSGGYLKINAGYYPNTKISLATLIGDDIEEITTTTADDSMLQGHRAYDKDGNVLLGTIGTSSITGSLTSSIDGDYVAPTLVTSKTTGKSYVTLKGNGSMPTGNVYSGTATAATKYMEVYTGSYSIS